MRFGDGRALRRNGLYNQGWECRCLLCPTCLCCLMNLARSGLLNGSLLLFLVEIISIFLYSFILTSSQVFEVA